MGETQMGQVLLADAGLGDTVRMGSCVVADMGALRCEDVLEPRDCGFDVAGAEGVDCCLVAERDLGIPETIGGGRSNPSVAFLVSCRAKSEACHHSRNFRAKMEAGRRNRNEERARG